MPRSRVLVIGDALLDVQVRPSIEPRGGADVPAAVSLGPGGQGANVAVRLVRRGISVRLACAIGADAAGRIVRDALEAEGVEIADLGATRTGAVVVLLDGAGERTMLSQRTPLLDGRAGRSRPVSGDQWVVVSGYALAEVAGLPAPIGEAKVRVVLGSALADDQVEGWVRAAKSLPAQLVILNLDEARAIAGEAVGPAQLSERLAHRLAAAVIVTHPAGAVAALDPTTVAVDVTRLPAFDTTGAGDAFSAGLIAELSAGDWPPAPRDVEVAMRRGLDLASAVAGVEGAQARVAGERGPLL